MYYKPLFNNVIIERTEQSKTTDGGIIIPDNAKERPSNGVVVAAGTNVEHVSVGDKVLFSKYAGTEVVLPGDSREVGLLVREEDILSIICEE